MIVDVQVRLFGAEAEAAGQPSVVVQVPQGADCAAVREALRGAAPSLAPLLGHARFAVNSAYAPDATIVRDGDEVALIGLVSGG